MTAFLGHLEQQRELVVRVGRPDVIDAQHTPTTLVHDLHSRRARGGLHPTHEHAHPATLPTQTSHVSDHGDPDQPTNIQVSGPTSTRSPDRYNSGLTSSGHIYSFSQSQVPGGGDVAALFRY